MKRLSIYLLIGFFVSALGDLFAQTNEKYVQVTNVEEIKKIFDDIKKASNTIDADFVQEKKVDILEKLIVSKGKFLFKQKNNLRLEYTSPSYYLVVMAAGRMMIKDGDRKTKIDSKGSKLFSQIQNIMTGIFGGQIIDNKDFRYALYKGDTNYKVKLFPQTGAVQDVLKEVEFIMSQNQLKAQTMTMHERSGDITVMKFSNVKMNTPINDKTFATY